MAMSLELLDFPPVLQSIDAHSLWHAATIFPAYMWYKYETCSGTRLLTRTLANGGRRFLLADGKRHVGGAVVGGSRFKE